MKTVAADGKFGDLTWYVEQEKLIHEGVERSRKMRQEIRDKYDPGHVYVIRFGSGLVKVGKTGDHHSRMRSHAKWANVYGDTIEDTWISARHRKQSKTERRLIALCKAHGQPVSREYFRGLAFETAVKFAELTVQMAEDEALIADRLELDRRRTEYLDKLLAAVDGDELATWATAHKAAFPGQDIK
jgi:hypothetical protein